MSFVLRLDPKKRAAGRFIGRVRDELIRAFLEAKKERGLTQAALASEIGVNKSRITRALKGEENLTLRSVAELASVLDREIVFYLRKRGDLAERSTQVLHREIGSSSDAPVNMTATVRRSVFEAAI